MTTTTAPAPTLTDYITEPPRLCPTCAAPIERHGRAWVCPKQRDEEARQQAIARAHPVTAATKARGRALVTERIIIDGALSPF